MLCIPDVGSEGMNLTFRKDISSWLRMIRYNPITVKVNAGFMSWTSRTGERSENGFDILAVGLRGDESNSTRTATSKRYVCICIFLCV